MSKVKRSSNKNEKEFDLVIRSFEKDHIALQTPASQSFRFFVIGFVVAAMPISLHISQLLDGNVTVGLNYLYFFVGIIIAGIALSHAYNGVATKARKALYIARVDNSVPNENVENSPILASVRSEAVAYALFTVNLSFLVVFALFSFYSVKNFALPPHFHYVICSTVPSFIALGISKAL